MQALDKAAIGQRIKSLRKSRGLRQWQMAQLLGATQPAVHKYENGILPEVKRLLELARIGTTSVEWILTGAHWENGSEEMPRMEREVYELARQIHGFTAEERRALGDALEILRAASDRLRAAGRSEPVEMSDAEFGRRVRSFEGHAMGPLLASLEVYDAVVATLASSRVRELRGFTSTAGEGEEADPDSGLQSAPLRKTVG